MSEEIENVVEVTEEPKEKSENELEEERIKKEQKKSRADELLVAVQTGYDKNLITRVANILNRYPGARESDLTLQMRYWETYNGVKSNTVDLDDMYKLERLTAIARARAKIQNEYELFQATDKTRRTRRRLEEQEKESQLLDKPAVDSLDVFSDETGKTANYAFVGGIWFLHNKTTSSIHRNFLEWERKKIKAGTKMPKEFHFKDLSNKNENELQIYKEFFNLIIENAEMISFKAVGVNRSKVHKIGISELIRKIHYQFIRLGIEHEIDSQRILLPKKINLTKDQDGESELILTNIKQDLVDVFELHYKDSLVMDQFVTMKASKNIFLQFADLFVASINRKYNVEGNGDNNKDKLAEYILNAVQLNEIKISASKVEVEDLEARDVSDHSVLFLFD